MAVVVGVLEGLRQKSPSRLAICYLLIADAEHNKTLL